MGKHSLVMKPHAENMLSTKMVNNWPRTIFLLVQNKFLPSCSIQVWGLMTSDIISQYSPDNKFHGANMGPTWGRQGPGGPHVGPMNYAIWEVLSDIIMAGNVFFRLFYNIKSPESVFYFGWRMIPFTWVRPQEKRYGVDISILINTIVTLIWNWLIHLNISYLYWRRECSWWLHRKYSLFT